MKHEKLVRQMTLEEKCYLLSGKDFWRTRAIERLDVYSDEKINDRLLGVFSWAINIPLMIGLMITPFLVEKFHGMYRLNMGENRRLKTGGAATGVK